MLDNGDFYDPRHRSAMLDFAAQPHACAPYYISDADAAAEGNPEFDPAANWRAYRHLSRSFNLGLNQTYIPRHWGA
jgi:hypothetical protein